MNKQTTTTEVILIEEEADEVAIILEVEVVVDTMVVEIHTMEEMHHGLLVSVATK